MIRIMKPGKTIRYKFVCIECGCEYIADLADIKLLYYDIRKENTCNCPNCGVLNFGTQIEYKED